MYAHQGITDFIGHSSLHTQNIHWRIPKSAIIDVCRHLCPHSEFNSDTTSTICAFKLSQTKRSQHHILLAHAEHHLAACHTLHMQSKMYSPTVYCILYIGRIPCTKLIHQHQLVCSRRRSENEADPHSLLSIMARCWETKSSCILFMQILHRVFSTTFFVCADHPAVSRNGRCHRRVSRLEIAV